MRQLLGWHLQQLQQLHQINNQNINTTIYPDNIKLKIQLEKENKWLFGGDIYNIKPNNKTFLFNKESKENGDLYGSIKPKEITNLIREKAKAEVNPSQIILKDNLNKIGVYKALINFHSDVKANISIKIDKIQSK